MLAAMLQQMGGEIVGIVVASAKALHNALQKRVVRPGRQHTAGGGATAA